MQLSSISTITKNIDESSIYVDQLMNESILISTKPASNNDDQQSFFILANENNLLWYLLLTQSDIFVLMSLPFFFDFLFILH